MKASCPHQEALGWGHGVTIALTKDTLTPAQRKAIDDDLFAACALKRNKEFDSRWTEIMQSNSAACKAIRAATGNENVSVADLEDLRKQYYHRQPIYSKVYDWLLNKMREEIQPEVFDAKIYTDSLMAPCPECGYFYGSKWLVRQLPPEIVELAKTALKDEWN
jgi:hypothetical protein